jgi:hypothetical protein
LIGRKKLRPVGAEWKEELMVGRSLLAGKIEGREELMVGRSLLAGKIDASRS